MAKLSAEQRRNLPKSDFAVPSKAPGSGSYPVEDKGHAKAALGRVQHFGTPSEKAAVRAKVHARFPSMKMKGK